MSRLFENLRSAGGSLTESCVFREMAEARQWLGLNRDELGGSRD